ncbi:hypothetical protein IFM89_003971 [Coptis chinensis]|uniref:Uncharacterized protein n=1 Tax=Coptis chinensis TaxID=261450 RepID=A0A835H4D2_9MAGN|nr:hypothetical protein IFM89_003971 [Coptis chinensis]
MGSLSYSGEVTVRRKRNKTSTRPLSEPFPISHDVLSVPSTPMSDILRNDTMDIDNTSKPVFGLQGVLWKDFSGGSFSLRKKGSSKNKMPGDDEQFDDGVNDEEIRYLEKLRSLKVTSDCDFNYEMEKAANAWTLPPNTIRWVIRPTGTIVRFSEDVGLPST